MTRFADTAPIRSLDVRAYTIPTETQPESDGTLQWSSTTLVAVWVDAGDARGFGYGFAHAAAARVIEDSLAPAVTGLDAMAPARAWEAMRHEARNLGVPGLVASAIGVVDIALWDLKGRLLDVSVSTLMGARRDRCPVYGSGGFTSYSEAELRDQLSGWVQAGIPRVKMKIGRDPEGDTDRVRAAREAIGPRAELFVDANGGYTRSQAVGMAHRFADSAVAWLEEPVSSDDLSGLRFIRERLPPGIQLAAGEYGWDALYFRRMCEAGAVDVAQPDVIRCGGFTGFLRAAEVCDGFATPISAHTAPQLSVHVCCAAPRVLHLEWFHDHVRIGRMLLDGFIEPSEGALAPDRGRAGIGLELKAEDAEEFRVY